MRRRRPRTTLEMGSLMRLTCPIVLYQYTSTGAAIDWRHETHMSPPSVVTVVEAISSTHAGAGYVVLAALSAGYLEQWWVAARLLEEGSIRAV